MKRLSFSIILILLIIIAASNTPQARVTGRCDNCHTMHNSQGGAPMAVGGTGAGWNYLGNWVGTAQETPNEMLLIADCVGCHTSTSSNAIIDRGGSRIPIVYNTSAPSEYLAGGNFYWVAEEGTGRTDAMGHNIFASNPDTLTTAPGNPGRCAGDCHDSLATAGSGCEGCHLNPAHHADDSATVIGAASPSTDGYYRFLSGHMSGSDHGVCCIEDSDWQYTANPTDHNEYLGCSGDKESIAGFYNLGHTMTAFCCGCHGNFHEEQDSSGSWLRHPSDAVILNSGEYRYAFGAGGTGTGIYDPLVPVARPSLSGWTEPSGSVTLGTGGDMVMCLSCHRPHGSPYYKMMRWDYKSTNLSTALSGCSKCHTSKD